MNRFSGLGLALQYPTVHLCSFRLPTPHLPITIKGFPDQLEVPRRTYVGLRVAVTPTSQASDDRLDQGLDDDTGTAISDCGTTDTVQEHQSTAAGSAVTPVSIHAIPDHNYVAPPIYSRKPKAISTRKMLAGVPSSQAITAVRWSPNERTRQVLAVGTAIGLVLVQDHSGPIEVARS